MSATLEASKVGNPIKGISNDLLADLYANSRTRNMYGPYTLKFLESDEAGIIPAETWPIEFGGKKATTLMQGFRNAVEKAGLQDVVQVRLYNDTVFLLNKERVEVVLAEATDADADED